MIAHGHVILSQHANVILVDARGPFNIEGIEEAIATYRAKVEQMALDQWYCIELWDDSVFGSLDVLAITDRFFAEDAKAGCQARVIVVTTQLQNNLLGRLFPLSHPHVTTDLALALDWIEREKGQFNQLDACAR